MIYTVWLYVLLLFCVLGRCLVKFMSDLCVFAYAS